MLELTYTNINAKYVIKMKNILSEILENFYNFKYVLNK